MNKNVFNYKISFFKEETEFFVNENNKTVTCVVKFYINFNPSCYNPLQILTTKGTAKCQGMDVFDVERGKRIAISKAENKAYQKVINILGQEMGLYKSYINSINNFIKKGKHQIKHNMDYIESLSDDKHPRYKKELSPFKKGITKFY